MTIDDEHFMAAMMDSGSGEAEYRGSTVDFILPGPTLGDWERWTAPPAPFEIEVDHLLGGPERGISPQHTDEAPERHVERQIRRLPGAVRRVLRSIKFAPHRAALLDFVESEFRRGVPQYAFREVVVPGDLVATRYTPEIHRRAGLARLAADASFLKRLKSRIDEIKRQGHVVNAYGGPPHTLPHLARTRIPAEGPWNAESSLGLSTTSVPEAMPEEVAAAIAQRTWRRFKTSAGRRSVGRVLHWGALNSTLALALQATSTNRTLEIHEVDTVGQPQSLSWVRSRTASIRQGTLYDVAVVHVPPPGEGANHLRNRYKDLPLPDGAEMHLEDMGRRGPRKWSRFLRSLIKEVIGHLKPDAELALLLPVACRVAPEIDGFARWGYDGRPELLEGVAALLNGFGLSVAVNVDVVEKNPLRQPYFVDRRCPWRLMIASRVPGVDPGEDDDIQTLWESMEADLA